MKCIKCGHEKIFHLQHGCVFHNNCDCENNAEMVKLLARIQELETAGRDADELIRYYIVGNRRIYSELNSEEKESIRKLAAMVNNTEKE